MKKYKPEQIVTLLRQIEVEIANVGSGCIDLASQRIQVGDADVLCVVAPDFGARLEDKDGPELVSATEATG
jgi:hypothetical protein